MKHLLNGVAIAAALAIASPAWAQAPAPSMAAPEASVAPMPMKQKHRPMRHVSAKSHHRGGGKMKASAGDEATSQLNRDELARLQGGGAPPPMAAPPAPMQGGPRPSGH